MVNGKHPPLLLAIDNGTQSVRALLFDLQGNLVAKSQVPLVAYVSPKPGWAEQDPDYFWEKLGEACRQLWATTDQPKEAVVGMAITTQRSTVINVDEQGRPLRPAIIWLDQRRTEGLPRLGGLWGLAFKATGMEETIAYFQAEAEANWINTHQPEIWRNTHKYLLLSGYLHYKLVGRFVDSAANQVGYLPFDFKKLQWAAGWDWKWRVLPSFRREQLPELVSVAQPIGRITAEAAAHTGIPAGLPVIAAAADKACEVIGSGALEPNIGGLSFGTTATINVTQRRYIEAIPLVPPYPAAVSDAYSLEIQVYRGFWMVDWFTREFGLEERQAAADQGVPPETLLDDLVSAVPPGSMGLMLQPYWSPGLKVPGPEARGAVIGWADVHTRAHLYRAILEGLAYALLEGAERIEKRTRTRITELRVAGGGSQSDAALQITADVFGKPAARAHIYETSGLGAAIDAAVGLKLHPDFATAVREMTRVGTRFEPQPHVHRIYTELYERVYKKMYGRLKPLYREIGEIINNH
ncbi:MAG: FGGY-family carbohydrate kinase [Ardenticatenaceae bacterium]|nr:FGGY-family carbohydrate kinase [Ardenticatenaceae bacterium]